MQANNENQQVPTTVSSENPTSISRGRRFLRYGGLFVAFVMVGTALYVKPSSKAVASEEVKTENLDIIPMSTDVSARKLYDESYPYDEQYYVSAT
jgi:hypothetical protein